MKPEANYVFEASWEVCNKVGGIYTVVSSKAAQMLKQYGQNYFLIGPYFPQKAYGIFEETVPPEACKGTFEKLKQEGIEVHCGKWLIKGEPHVMLIDFSRFTSAKNGIKKALWDKYQIDSLNTEYYDFDEPIIWAWAAGKVIQALSEVFDKKIVAHFHEWLAGAAGLYLKMHEVKVATVFTTHATVLGRTLSTANIDLYSVLDSLNPDEEVKKYGAGTKAKHQLEKQCAQNADVFTTVSEITGIEAEKILGRKPEVLVFNGLDMARFPSFEEASIKHRLFKTRIKQFLLFYFFPYYSFDIDKVLFFFIAGRYEFRDKGIDIFITALGKLNEKLKEEKCDVTIVSFFFVPGNVKSIKPTLLENRKFFYDIKDTIDDHQNEIMNKMLYNIIAQRELSKKTLFDENSIQSLKRKTLRLLRKGNPPISTHDLFNENQDQIVNALKAANLNNTPEDVVKAVFYPIYLTGADNLLDTDYYESMLGCHLGVFPSVYEPWGYTPLEAAALGVSSVTTDLSGFGRYLCAECEQGKFPGTWVIKRYKKSQEDAVNELTKVLYDYSHFTKHERAENKIAARKVAKNADWEKFIERYVRAHNLAIQKAFK